MHSRPTLTKKSSYAEIFQRLSELTTPNICDAYPLCEAYSKVRVMDRKIKPKGKIDQCIGLAYTVNSNQDSIATMLALDDVTAFLATLNCGENIVPIILTIASCGSNLALVGGTCAKAADKLGYAGVLTDGPCRDLEEINNPDISIPIFAKGHYAQSGSKDKLGTRKERIDCGGVTVDPGDIIFGDKNGVVVLKTEEAIQVIPKAEKIKVNEAKLFKKLDEGAKFYETCNIREHAEKLQSGTSTQLRITL